MANLTYPIEILKREIKKLNKVDITHDVDGMYHLDKLSQIFKAIELLQEEHLEEKRSTTKKSNQ